MHVTGIRRTLVEQHPWLPVAAFKAFAQSKARALAKLGDLSWKLGRQPALDSARLAELDEALAKMRHVQEAPTPERLTLTLLRERARHPYG